MRPIQLLLAALSAASLASASWTPEAGAPLTVAPTASPLMPRADEESGSAQSPSPTPQSNDDKPSASASPSPSGSASDKDSKDSSSDSSSNSKPSGTSSKSSKTAFDPRLPPGGIQMITPAALAGPQYYKIGDFVTFAWNYTSLSVTPTAVNVVASCSANQATYTIAMNQSVQATGQVVWDTGKYQSTATIPLLTESYTLMIYDSARGPSAVASAGYLATFNQMVFGMYAPQAYTPLGEFQCATCLNSGASMLERHIFSSLLTVFSIVLLSFAWFTTGRFGLA